MLPADVAAKQAARSTTLLPLESWLLAVLQPQPQEQRVQEQGKEQLQQLQQGQVQQGQGLEQQGQEQQGQGQSNQKQEQGQGVLGQLQGQEQGQEGQQGQGQAQPPPLQWQLSGLFLDLSCRGGAVLTQQQLQLRYPVALHGAHWLVGGLGWACGDDGLAWRLHCSQGPCLQCQGLLMLPCMSHIAMRVLCPLNACLSMLNACLMRVLRRLRGVECSSLIQCSAACVGT